MLVTGADQNNKPTEGVAVPIQVNTDPQAQPQTLEKPMVDSLSQDQQATSFDATDQVAPVQTESSTPPITGDIQPSPLETDAQPTQPVQVPEPAPDAQPTISDHIDGSLNGSSDSFGKMEDHLFERPDADKNISEVSASDQNVDAKNDVPPDQPLEIGADPLASPATPGVTPAVAQEPTPVAQTSQMPSEPLSQAIEPTQVSPAADQTPPPIIEDPYPSTSTLDTQPQVIPSPVIDQQSPQGFSSTPPQATNEDLQAEPPVIGQTQEPVLEPAPDVVPQAADLSVLPQQTPDLSAFPQQIAEPVSTMPNQDMDGADNQPEPMAPIDLYNGELPDDINKLTEYAKQAQEDLKLIISKRSEIIASPEPDLKIFQENKIALDTVQKRILQIKEKLQASANEKMNLAA